MYWLLKLYYKEYSARNSTRFQEEHSLVRFDFHTGSGIMKA